LAYRLAIFDFDGTLADSFGFFVEVFNELADRHGFCRIAADEVPALRRLTVRERMRRSRLPMRTLPAVAADFVGLMRARRADIRPFAGIEALLADLAEAGVDLGVVSSNAEDNVVAILGTAAGRVRHFECGMSIFGKRRHLRGVLRDSGVKAAEALYIGDQSTDFEAARAERIAFGAIGWGYGDFERLKSLRPEHACADLGDLRRLLLG
jgi:phosphoglycolate phosphatase